MDSKVKLACAVLFLLITILFCSMAPRPMTPNGDSQVAYLSYNHSSNGGSFNTIPLVDPRNISTSKDVFLSWWTPGQYLLPAIIFNLSSSWSVSEKIVTAVSILVGLVGFWCLLRQLCFSPIVAICSLLFIVSRRDTLWYFLQYGAGNLLLFALTPWVVSACLRFRRPFIRYSTSIFSLFMLAVFMKSSALIVMVALVLTMLVLKFGRSRSKIGERYIFAMTLAALVTYILWYLFYLSLGDTPNSLQQDISLINDFSLGRVNDLLFVVSQPASMFFSLDSYLPVILGKVNFPSSMSYLLSAIVNLLLLIFVFKRNGDGIYRTLMFSFCATYFTFFAFEFSAGGLISRSNRHFMPLLFVITPGFISAILSLHSRMLVYPLSTLIVLAASWELRLFYKHHLNYKETLTLTSDGRTIRKSEHDIALAIQELDSKSSDEVAILLIYPWHRNLELIVRNSRLISMGPAYTGIPIFRRNFCPTLDEMEEVSYSGRVSKLYLVTTEEHFNSVAGCFQDYTDFRPINISESSELRIYEAN